jgi:hypothetical protein
MERVKEKLRCQPHAKEARDFQQELPGELAQRAMKRTNEADKAAVMNTCQRRRKDKHKEKVKKRSQLTARSHRRRNWSKLEPVVSPEPVPLVFDLLLLLH